MIKTGIHKTSLFLSITILWFFNISVFGQESAQISIPFEICNNAGDQKTLYLGWDQTAKDDIDIHFSESNLPPFSPLGAFEARWILLENNFNVSLSSWSYYRFAPGFSFSCTIEHRFRYQSAGGATAMLFSWNFPPEITDLIQDLSNGVIINFPISGSGTYQINAFDAIDKLKLLVYYNNVVTNSENIPHLTSSYILEQNYPNPFNPSTRIKFSIPENTGNVRLSIYNALDEKICELVDKELTAGNYQYQWDADNESSGIYFYE